MSNLSKDIPILMTASVSTRGMKGACFTDAEREQMYVQALTCYITGIMQKDREQKIVFAENSGWDLNRLVSRLTQYDNKRIEFLSLNPERFDISRGKGYNEMLLINMAVAKSKFLRHSGCFFKVTGRYPIYNLDHFVNKSMDYIYKQNYDMYCDVKDHNLYDWLRLGWNGHSFDCRLFAVTTKFWQHQFAEHYVDCNDYDGHLMEDIMFTNVKSGGVKLAIALTENRISGDLKAAILPQSHFQKNRILSRVS